MFTLSLSSRSPALPLLSRKRERERDGHRNAPLLVAAALPPPPPRLRSRLSRAPDGAARPPLRQGRRHRRPPVRPLVLDLHRRRQRQPLLVEGRQVRRPPTPRDRPRPLVPQPLRRPLPGPRHLRFLTSLSVAANQLSGPIPPQISALAALRHLNLSNNVFNGTFPPQLGLLKNLRVLDLYNNNMTGDLPVAVAEMPQLRHLHLGGNYFAGKIPPEYGRWELLEYLAVSGNELVGAIPPEIGNLTTLRELYLGYYNSYDGGLPPEIGNLTELVRLDAANCGLTGEIPPEISKLQNLDTLFLQVNAFAGSLTPQLGSLKSLKSLDLSNNVFSGEIPESFSQLKNLTLLHLFRNKLNGEIPEFIADLPELQVLQLWENNFTGSVPQGLGKNGNLQIVDLSSNKLTGNLPPDLCYGNQLQTLIALGNYLLGPIPESLGKCRSLRRIRMGDNFLNGSIPRGLFGLPELTQVEFQDNLLVGEFPVSDDSIAVNLGQISLSNNKLGGSLPPTIGNFSGVQKLLLDGNNFSGQIPPEMGRLQQLSKIDFSSNGFSGPIPTQISRCKLLTFVDLSGNELSGEIPNEITGMRILNYLNLSRNHLSGSIPSSISTMQSLTSVDFSYNNLSGLVPGTGQFSYFNYTSFSNPSNTCQGATLCSVKLLLVIGLLVCSIIFAIVAIIKARSLKKASDARAWKFSAFQRLDFSCEDVLDSLKEDNIIGKGGAGIVYKGAMPNGDQVAVKGFLRWGEGLLMIHGFNAEIQTLGKNQAQAHCKAAGFLLKPRNQSSGGHLIWSLRYKIALEAAKGLCYLHHDCSPLIVHRDVKSNNILLDSDLKPMSLTLALPSSFKIRAHPSGMSAIAGSYGYIAPEYAYTLKVDEKSDVYSFGVVLLELVTGRKPVGEFGDGVDIVQWVRKMTNSNKEEVQLILDPRLSTVPLNEAMHLFYVAMLCVEEQAVERPTMREVVQILTEFPKPCNSNKKIPSEPNRVSHKRSERRLSITVAATRSFKHLVNFLVCVGVHAYPFSLTMVLEFFFFFFGRKPWRGLMCQKCWIKVALSWCTVRKLLVGVILL
ncbi:Protein kinase domain-containing protein [Psidium guajava]|nr:Protein kinase domain-containing protein [Psidium guajava]